MQQLFSILAPQPAAVAKPSVWNTKAESKERDLCQVFLGNINQQKIILQAPSASHRIISWLPHKTATFLPCYWKATFLSQLRHTSPSPPNNNKKIQVYKETIPTIAYRSKSIFFKQQRSPTRCNRRLSSKYSYKLTKYTFHAWWAKTPFRKGEAGLCSWTLPSTRISTKTDISVSLCNLVGESQSQPNISSTASNFSI